MCFDLLPFFVVSTPTSSGMGAYQAFLAPPRYISNLTRFIPPQPGGKLYPRPKYFRIGLWSFSSTAYLSCLTTIIGFPLQASPSFEYSGGQTRFKKRGIFPHS